MKVLFRRILPFVCCAAAFVIACLVARDLWPFGRFEISGSDTAYSVWYSLVSIALRLILPTACALLVFGLVGWILRRAGKLDGELPTPPVSVPAPRWVRAFLYTFVVLFFLTWIFGAPAVQSSLHEKAIGCYLSAQKFENRATSPYVMTEVCFPVFPGILLSYHEYQVASLSGLGAWYVHVWYVTGTKSFAFLQVWIS